MTPASSGIAGRGWWASEVKMEVEDCTGATLAPNRSIDVDRFGANLLYRLRISAILPTSGEGGDDRRSVGLDRRLAGVVHGVDRELVHAEFLQLGEPFQ